MTELFAVCNEKKNRNSINFIEISFIVISLLPMNFANLLKSIRIW